VSATSRVGATTLLSSAPLRTGRADCSASGSSLCRSVSHPLVMPVMAPPVQKASLGGAEDPVLDAPYGGLRRSPIDIGPRHRLSPVGLFGSHRLTSPTGTGVQVHGFR
jgi:hypothetical protein